MPAPEETLAAGATSGRLFLPLPLTAGIAGLADVAGLAAVAGLPESAGEADIAGRAAGTPIEGEAVVIAAGICAPARGLMSGGGTFFGFSAFIFCFKAA